MRESAPRILFVPVSGPYGMGEYARSSAIARAVIARWPGADVQFVLSRAAAYAADVPFTTTWLDSSATFHSAAVVDLIDRMRPDVAIFDNAGRTAQLRAARAAGARIVYISARGRQRRKAFRMSWMRLLDEHWIAYPKFIVGELTLAERIKRRLLHRPVLRYLDVSFSRASPARRAEILASAGCEAGEYVLLVPGGGTGHPGVHDAVDQFFSAALHLAACKRRTVFVGPPRASAADGMRMPGLVAQSDLAALMSAARLVIANGGSTLLQAIACGVACVAVPIANDQKKRIHRCVQAGVAEFAPLDGAAISGAAERLLGDESARTALARRAAALELADGVAVALGAIDALLR